MDRKIRIHMDEVVSLLAGLYVLFLISRNTMSNSEFYHTLLISSL